LKSKHFKRKKASKHTIYRKEPSHSK